MELSYYGKHTHVFIWMFGAMLWTCNRDLINGSLERSSIFGSCYVMDPASKKARSSVFGSCHVVNFVFTDMPPGLLFLEIKLLKTNRFERELQEWSWVE